MGFSRNRYTGIDPRVVRIIRCKAGRLARRREFAGYEIEDLEQELALHYLRRADRFDPERASLPTFASRILNNRTAALIEWRHAAKRDFRRRDGSLNEPIQLQDGSFIERGETFDGSTCAQRLGCQKQDPDALDLSIDLDRAVAKLPPRAQGWCQRLREGTVAEASRDTTTSRSTIYDDLKDIRRRFEEDGLREYVKARSDTFNRIPVHNRKRATTATRATGGPMSGEVYRYTFSPEISMSDVEESLLLAVLAVECLHGGSVVRLEAAYYLDQERRCCVVDATTTVGRDVTRIFTGFLTREFGEDAFKVKKITPTDGEPVLRHDLATPTNHRGLGTNDSRG